MTEAIAWALVALLVAAACAFAWMLRPDKPEERAPELPESRVPRCETCERWQGARAAESAMCTWTRKVEERSDGCSRHVARRTP